MVSFLALNLYFGMRLLLSMLNLRSFATSFDPVNVAVVVGVGESTPESRDDSRVVSWF